MEEVIANHLIGISVWRETHKTSTYTICGINEQDELARLLKAIQEAGYKTTLKCNNHLGIVQYTLRVKRP